MQSCSEERWSPKRLEWNTEAGPMRIYASNEEDIWLVAQIINKLLDRYRDRGSSSWRHDEDLLLQVTTLLPPLTYYDFAAAPQVPSVVQPLGSLVPIPYGGFSVELLAAAGGWAGSAPDLLRHSRSQRESSVSDCVADRADATDSFHSELVR